MVQEAPLPPEVAVLLAGGFPEQGCEARQRPCAARRPAERRAAPVSPAPATAEGRREPRATAVGAQQAGEVGGDASRDAGRFPFAGGGASAASSASARDVR